MQLTCVLVVYNSKALFVFDCQHNSLAMFILLELSLTISICRKPSLTGLLNKIVLQKLYIAYKTQWEILKADYFIQTKHKLL